MVLDASISLPETAWETETLDAAQIQTEVNRLWDHVNAATPRASVPGNAGEDDVVSSGPISMHAATFNLIAVASSDAEAEFMKETVSQLRDFLPSRTIVLVIGDEPASESANYRIAVGLREQRKSTPGELHFETITIATDVREIGRLASLVNPLLLPELPGYLWRPVDTLRTRPLFFDLAEIVDRMIIDSSQLGSNPRQIPLLRELSDPNANHAIVGDFAWLRLATWRQLIAQFFDPDDVLPSLNAISEVNIAYAGPRPDGSSGLGAALLAVGWLASRLDWDVIEPLDTNKAGVSWAPLRARGAGGRQRDVQVRLTPDNSPHARFSLRRVELLATGEAPGVFRVERTDDDDLITSSETPSVPFVSRMVYSRRPESTTMLSAEVQRLSSDRVYEEALQTAVKLLP